MPSNIPPNMVPSRISIKESEDENKLNIIVYNTGKGISKENIPLIFNRYSILDNIKENSIKAYHPEMD